MRETSAFEEYRRKLANGEVERTIPLNPAEKAEKNPKSLRLAINAKCWDCTNQQRLEIKHCEMTDCSLHGLRPYQEKT